MSLGSADGKEPSASTARPPIKAAGLVHRLRDHQRTLRLVRDEEDQSQSPGVATPGRSAARAQITDLSDPRWVLALRTAESLQGAILGLERRERLVKLGQMLGLTAFDANLVIAIVQDQARRGYAPEYCPTAGEAQLAMVPLPRSSDPRVDARTRRITIICGVIGLLVGLELVVLKWLFS